MPFERRAARWPPVYKPRLFPVETWPRSHQLLLRVEAWAFLLGTVPAVIFGGWLMVLVVVASGLAWSFLLVRYLDAVLPLSRLFSLAPVLGVASRRAPVVLAAAGYLVAALTSGSALTVMWIYELLSLNTHSALLYVWVYGAATSGVRTVEANRGPVVGKITNALRLGVAIGCAQTAVFGWSPWILTGVYVVMTFLALYRHALFMRLLVDRVAEHAAPVGEPGRELPLLTVFAPPTGPGRELANQVAGRAAEQGYEVEIAADVSQEAVFRSVLSGDVTVFDASAGRGPDILAAGMYLLKSAYAITVSRSELPMSFPSFDPIAPPRGTTADTAELVELVSERLAELRPGLPRPPEQRGVGSADAVLEAGLDALYDRRRRDVFISYRGHAELDVTRLSEQEAHRSVRFLRGGELATADELLSGQRRWEVLVAIRRWIRSADEVWIYDTDDFTDSWWTRAELVLMALAGTALEGKVHRYDPGTRTLSPVSLAALPVLNARQRKRITKLLYFGANPEYCYRLAEATSAGLARLLVRRGDEVLSDRFRDDLLVQCTAPARPRQGYRFDVDAFLDELHGIDGAEVLAAAGRNGEVGCPACGRRYAVRLDAPRSRWYPRRDGVGTGPGGVTLEELPTVLAVRHAS
jgi:hypothetical protein